MFFRSPHHPCRRSERGVSLVEYGLVTSLFLVGALGVLNQLTDNSEDLLNESGTDIATPRPYDEALDDAPVAEAPANLDPPTTSELLTFLDKEIEIEDRCVGQNGGGVILTPCTSSNVVTVTGLSEDGVTMTLAVGDTGQCLGFSAGNPVLGSCSNSAQAWEQDAVSGVEVVYRHVDTGLCLTKDGNGLELQPCGSSSQVFTVNY